MEFEYYQGVSGAGDGDVIDASITAGLRSGRGSILFSAGYHNRKPVWTGDRSFSEADKNYDWGGERRVLQHQWQFGDARRNHN